jgi:hypothetical protein
MGIALLYRLYQSDAGTVIVQDSLLWGRHGMKAKPRWGEAFLEKILGPFDFKNFGKARHFWTFWIGEKCLALGFLWGMIRRRAAAGPITRRGTTGTAGVKEASVKL